MEPSETRRPVVRPRGLLRLVRDAEGAALLETVIVLPILAVFMVAIMELSLYINAKQLANYAAFCAARTAAVYGVSSDSARQKSHLAAALAMSSISPGSSGNPAAVLGAYGIPNPDAAVAALCAIPGFQGDTAVWIARLANSHIRTTAACTTGTVSGKARSYVVANVTYVYRCSILPFGVFWGQAGLNSYITMLKGLSFYNIIRPTVELIESTWRWNVLVHGRAVTDYWAD